MRILSAIKSSLISDEKKPTRVPLGLFQGMKLELSLRHQSQVYAGLFEREIYGWIRNLSKGIKTAIDIGAAQGEYALFFMLRTDAEKVYAFEPSQDAIDTLVRNAELNGIDFTSERFSLRKSLVGEMSGENVVTLDSLSTSLRYPCLVKLDVDGAEEAVLSGAATVNSQCDIRWLIETHSAELERSCLRILQSAGFHTRVIKNAWWRALVPELRPVAHNRWLAAWKLRPLNEDSPLDHT